jgi:5-methylcytosine-specific restriction endonuclease McrA
MGRRRSRPSFTAGKIQKIRDRDGDCCWLCHKPMVYGEDVSPSMRLSVDHYIPRKWGGSNRLENLRLAHTICNSHREIRFPETMRFTEEEITCLTNPTTPAGGLSKRAMKAVKAMRSVVA